IRFDTDVPVALGTAQGVVKRIVPDALAAKPELDVISLKPGDRVVGAAEAADDSEVVFVTDHAQLLRFDAANVRPQGAPASGMAGMKLSAGAEVIFFGATTRPDAVVVTLSGDGTAIAGTEAGRAKITDFSEFPAKGRATAGVRAHSLLKGETALTLAWVGPDPAHAVDATGSVRKLPDTLARRDASGHPLDAVITSIGRALA
ncbi:MAG: DNA gyrase C-terminal beta-propeller domain-containing protein, partial [Microbacterium sp.]